MTQLSATSVEATPPPAGVPARFSAMVYDCDHLHGKLTCRGLERQGFRCDYSYRPSGVRARLQGGAYDLILIDLREAKAEQVKVAGDAFAYRRRAKILAIVSPGANEIVSALLAYGVDEIVTEGDGSDPETLGGKAASLLEIEAWRQEAILSQRGTPMGKLLESIEQALLERSGAVQRRIGDPFGIVSMPSSFREAIANGVERARRERSGAGANSDNRRRSERESVCLTAAAIPLDELGNPSGDAFAVMIGDVSMTGARLAHTRPVTQQWHALQWRCASIADKTVTVGAEIVRCDTVGRFYEIGARFV